SRKARAADEPGHGTGVDDVMTVARLPTLTFLLSASGFAALLWLAAAGVCAETRELTFDVRIAGGVVPANMALIRVRQGDKVRLRFTSDRSITVHLHGYDIERRIEPGAVVELAFTARATGRFPVEEHRQGAQGHSHADAPLIRIEVYPR